MWKCNLCDKEFASTDVMAYQVDVGYLGVDDDDDEYYPEIGTEHVCGKCAVKFIQEQEGIECS